MALPRIAYFLEHYPQPGGTTTAVCGLSQALIRKGWEVIIYCCGKDCRPSNQEGETSGIGIIRFRSRRWHPFDVDPKLLTRLSHNRDNIQLLVISHIFTPSAIAVARAARSAGIPYVVWPHDPYHPNLLRSGRWKKSVYGLLYERPLLNRAAAIQVLAQEHSRFLLDYGVRRPVLVIPNGFDPQEVAQLEPQQPPQLPRQEEDLRILYLGRLDMQNKGLDLLLVGLSRGVHSRMLPPTLRLDFVGPDWGDQDKLELLAKRLRIAQNVRFLGRVPKSRYRIISCYEALVLPSRWEGFGLAALEAMVVAKPVIVSEEAGISSYVKQAQCGYLVQPNANSICDQLVHAVQTKAEWQSMGRRGQEFAYENLTWDKSAEQASRCYARLISEEDIRHNPPNVDQSLSATMSESRLDPGSDRLRVSPRRSIS